MSLSKPNSSLTLNQPLVYELPLAYGKSSSEVSADFKVEPEDFIVEELLNFELSNQGEHICLFIEKKNRNTSNIVNLLARHFKIPHRDISYAGLKDKQAVTRQWFSLRVGLKGELNWQDIEDETLKVLCVKRNIRKIKRGSHSGNSFSVRLKNVSGDFKSLVEKTEQISQHGVPNYFGPQRFGHNMGNITQALSLFTGEIKINDKFLRGLYISAARSWLFNQILAKRVMQTTWNTYLSGDVMSLSGTASNFVPQIWDENLAKRLEELDIHPSGPLWGKGALRTGAETESLENSLQQEYPDLCRGLVESGLSHERRALRLPVQKLQVSQEKDNNLIIEFNLGKGAFATSVLRELVTIRNWRI